jgi:hypothetical protein
LEKHGGTKVLFLVPPIGWAGCAAASTQNALVEAVQLLAIGLGLAEFAALIMLVKVMSK